MGAIRLLACAVFLAAPAASSQTFMPAHNLPQPAPGAFTIVGTNLPDGRFVLWNGDGVYVQSEVGGGIFGLAAKGYAGDPGFIALAPDGHTLLLGAGFGDGSEANAYLVDVFAPVDFAPGSELTLPNHAAGLFLTQDLVLLDRGKSDFSGSELVVVDLSAAKSGMTIARTVLRTPPAGEKDLVVDKPAFSFSSNVILDPTGTEIYAMDANTLELRTFDVADIINAFNTSTPLDWSTDGTLFGSAGVYFSGGVEGFTSSNELVIDGSSGFLQPGGIQFVDRNTGTINQTLTPAGVNEFYSVIFNSVTEEMILRLGSSNTTFATTGVTANLPAAGAFGIALLSCAIAVAARRAMRQRN